MPAKRPARKQVHVSVAGLDIVSFSQEFDQSQEGMVQILSDVILASLPTGLKHAPIKLPTGDGMILVFPGESANVALAFACQVQRTIRDRHLSLPVRTGIHEGSAVLYTDVNGMSNVVGQAVNICQRVMDAGDAHHILLSENAYEGVKNSDEWRSALHPLLNNPVEVKHYLQLNLYKYHDGLIGNSAEPTKYQGSVGLRTAAICRKVGWPELLATQQKLKMIDISMPLFGTPALLDYLEELVGRETVHVQVLLLNPASAAAHLRRRARAYDSPSELHTTIEYVAKILLGFRSRLAKRYGSAAETRFEVRLYDTIPTMSAFITDQHAYTSFYLEHLSGSRSPFFVSVRQPGRKAAETLYGAVEQAFDHIWTERSVSLWDRALAKRTAKMIEGIMGDLREFALPPSFQGP